MNALRIVVLVTFALGASPGYATYAINKDLVNRGPVADDLTVILSGSETILNHYDGQPPGFPNPYAEFGSFSTGPTGPNTALVWDVFKDGDNNRIDTGQFVHVGWSTLAANGIGKILDMFWTDPLGNRIPGSVVYNTQTGWTYDSRKHLFTAIFDNFFSPEGLPSQPLLISDLQFAVLSQTIPLDQLNGENALLAGLLAPVPDSAPFTVGVGELVERSLLVPVDPGEFVVFRYSVNAPGTAAQSLDFVEIQAAVPEPSTWLLLATGTLGLLGYRWGRKKMGQG